MIFAAVLMALAQSQAVEVEILLPRSLEPTIIAYVVADCVQEGAPRTFKVVQAPHDRVSRMTLELSAGTWKCSGYAWTIDDIRLAVGMRRLH